MSRTTLPSIFLRSLLSHLILLLACLVFGMGAVFYLFPDQIAMYFSRSPVILFPVVLGLLGLAGLLANWTSASTSLRIEEMTEALRSPDPVGVLMTGLEPSPVQEVEELRRTLLAWEQRRGSLDDMKAMRLIRASSRRLVILETNRDGLLTDYTPLLEEVSRQNASSLIGLNPLDFLQPESHHDEVPSLLSGDPVIQGVSASLAFPNRPTIEAEWSALTRYDPEGNVAGRRIFGILYEPFIEDVLLDDYGDLKDMDTSSIPRDGFEENPKQAEGVGSDENNASTEQSHDTRHL